MVSAWSRPRGLLDRLLGRGQRRREVGTLRADADAIWVEHPEAGTLVRLPWSQPILCKVSCWSAEQGCEVNASLRTRGAPVSDPWLQLRFMWPQRQVVPGCPRKQELFPFVHPSALLVLWPVLDGLAQVHGAPPPEGVGLEVTPGDLEGLWSQSQMPLCAACDAASVLFVAPQVYRCNVCGYEGGEGMAKLMRLKHEARLDALSPAQKQQRALAEAREARRILLGCFGDVDFYFDKNNQNNTEEVIQRRLARVPGWVMEAREHLRDVAYLVPEVEPQATQARHALSWAEGSLEEIKGRSYQEELERAHQLLEHIVVAVTTQGQVTPGRR
jgi:hypothetical protein